MRAIIDAGTVVASLAIRILGRTTAEDVHDPASNKVMVPTRTLLTSRKSRRSSTPACRR